VKILDFGLAKAMSSETPPSGDAMASPILTMRATMAGTIMGTAAYMSPEQAKGKPVDRRADIWAFGVVLAEMITGCEMYGGETVSETPIGSDVRSTLRVGRIADVTSAQSRRNNVTHLLATR